MRSAFLKSLSVVAAGICCGHLSALAQVSGPVTNNPPPQTHRDLRAGFGAQGTAGTPVVTPAGRTGIFLTLSGMGVNDITGQPVGTLQYLLLEPNGSASVAVGMINGRLIPVPWQLISASGDATATPGRVALTVNVDRQRLLQAPAITTAQLSQLLQDPFLQQLYAFYGLQNPNQDQFANQGAFGFRTNTLTGFGTNTAGAQTGATATGTNAISPPPPTGPPGVPSPVLRPQTTPDRSGQSPDISRPPDTGPGSVGTPAPRPQPTPGAQQPTGVQPAPR